MSEIVETFLHNLRILINELKKILPMDDPVLYRANKRISLVIDFYPLWLFEETGKALYEYKEYVYNPETEEVVFTQNVFQKKVDIIQKSDVAELVVKVMEIIKKESKNVNKEHKLFIRNILIKLLDDYIEYKIIEED